MSFATVQSCTLSGVQALPVTVEVHISGGLPGTSIVGLPQSAVRESKDRVKAAIQHIGLNYPQVRIIVNLAPADLPKRGGRFDLPIALGILMATGQLPEQSVDGLMVLGELGLTGELRSVTGVLPTACAFAGSRYSLYIPGVNVDEALHSTRTRVHGVDSLKDACVQLRNRRSTPLVLCKSDSVHASLPSRQRDLLGDRGNPVPVADKSAVNDCRHAMQGESSESVDMSEVFGQHKARRALEIAAAGAHNVLMVGSPGTGKSMLATRLPGIQPPMSEMEAMETASVQSISHRGFENTHWGIRPFRSPHHTASGVALVGGGSVPMPGEISLAHQGVLFLDELPEFSRAVLDVLREPMETGRIIVSRAARQAEFPSRFQLVAAMNPCPCGYHNDSSIQCRCGADQILRYQSRVSGPLLDRIDLHLYLQREIQSIDSLENNGANESSQTVRLRVVRARKLQIERQGCSNSLLGIAELHRNANTDGASQTLLKQASEKLCLSLRVQHRVLRVARTIADLDGEQAVSRDHLAESLSYRKVPALNA